MNLLGDSLLGDATGRWHSGRVADTFRRVDPMSLPLTRITPLTVISPIRPGWTPFARVVMQVLPQTPWGASPDLQELKSVQSARWSLITELPTPAGRVRPKYDYLYFESNFNGGFDSYLETFADVLSRRMRLIWNSSYGFPNLPEDAGRPLWRRLRRPIPHRAFVDYVTSANVPTDHYYCAYPQAGTTEVLAGLQAEELLADLRGRVLAVPEGQSPPSSHSTAFGAAFSQAMTRLQTNPPLGEQPSESLGDRRGGMYAFTALTPVTRGREGDLRAVLSGLGTGRHSPFSAMPGVHFARWVVIDAPGRQPGQQRDGWPQSYLLTSTTSDGAQAPLEEMFDALAPVREEVWGRCDGYPHNPSRAAFTRYLAAGRVPTGRFYTAYPSASVGAVRSGVDTAERLSAFARRHQCAGDADLLAAFRDEFCR